MPDRHKSESTLVTTSPDFSADEIQNAKESILKIIKSCENFYEEVKDGKDIENLNKGALKAKKGVIKELEEKNLIWYFIDALQKDKDKSYYKEIKKTIKSDKKNIWKEFEKFYNSINETHKQLKSSLEEDLGFLVYPIYPIENNHFQIRFESKSKNSVLKPIEISKILKEGKTYNIPLGKGSQVIAKQKGGKRYYDFTNSESLCEMTINWHADGINCSITVKVGSDGIGSIKAVSFGESEEKSDHNKMIDLVRTNAGLVDSHKKVYLNNLSLSEALAKYLNRGKNHSLHQPPEESIPQQAEDSIAKGTPKPTLRRSLFSSGFGDGYDPGSYNQDEQEKIMALVRAFNKESIQEINRLENALQKQKNEFHNERTQLEEKIDELEKENTELQRRYNKKITEEGDQQIKELEEENQALEGRITTLTTELRTKDGGLDKRDEEIALLQQKIDELEQSLEKKNNEVKKLQTQLKDKEGKIQSTNNINEDLQKKLDQTEAELNRLVEENRGLESLVSKQWEELAVREKGLEKQAQSLKELQAQNEKFQQENTRLEKELRELRDLIDEKERPENALETVTQQPNAGGTSLFDEINVRDNKKDEKIRELEEKSDQKDNEMEKIRGDLGTKLKKVTEQEEQLRKELQLIQEELEQISAKLQSERDGLKYTLTAREEELNNIRRGLEKAQVEAKKVTNTLQQSQRENKQLKENQEKEKPTVTSSVQTILTSYGKVKNFYDKDGNVALIKVRQLPDSQISDPKPTAAKTPGKSPTW